MDVCVDGFHTLRVAVQVLSTRSHTFTSVSSPAVKSISCKGGSVVRGGRGKQCQEGCIRKATARDI